MNILAHWYLSESRSEEFKFGAILPDLAKMGGGRVIRLNNPRERASLPDGLKEVYRGVDFHVFTDQAYDNLPQVSRLRRVYADEIYPHYFRENRLLKRFLPVVLGDLLLDGVLLRGSPMLREVVATSVARSDTVASVDVSTIPNGLDEVKSRFISNIPDYAMIDDVLLATQGLLKRRFGFELTRDGRAALFGSALRYRAYVEHAGPSILLSIGMIARKYHDNDLD